MPPAQVAEEAEPGEPGALVAWILRGDPLARRPRLPVGPAAAALPGLAAWQEVASRQGPVESSDWWRLERAHPGTVAVPLARGARLAEAETHLDDPLVLVGALVSLLPATTAPPADAREPLAWLGVDGAGVLPVLERAVLYGWLDGPGLASGAAALDDPAFARLAGTPAAILLAAHRRGEEDTAARAAALSALDAAILHALDEAAADADSEQLAMRGRRSAVLAAHPGATDPVAALLGDAERSALLDAGHPQSVGVALVAAAATRWREACPDRPCGGYDRLGLLDAAVRFDPALAGRVDTWRATLWKEAVDALEASWAHSSVTPAVDDVTELVAATEVRVLDLGLLRRREPEPAVALAWCRALGLNDATSREGVLLELSRHVGRVAAAAVEGAPPEARATLVRVARRAGK